MTEFKNYTKTEQLIEILFVDPINSKTKSNNMGNNLQYFQPILPIRTCKFICSLQLGNIQFKNELDLS